MTRIVLNRLAFWSALYLSAFLTLSMVGFSVVLGLSVGRSLGLHRLHLVSEG